jgi:Fic family protein
MYIWQQPSWPVFRWDSQALITPLGQTRRVQGEVLILTKRFGLTLEPELICDEALTTSAIEGERINPDHVRSSVARRLGLPTAGLTQAPREIDGLVNVLIDATRHHHLPLTHERLFGWQAALFPSGYSGLNKILVGRYRRDDEPMQVVSGPMGKEKIHFEAPPSHLIPSQMDQFIAWFNQPSNSLDGFLRAAIAHLWFVTLHPFADGNGRLARSLTDMALAQDEETSVRLYSMSSQIMARRDEYYRILEETQRGDGEISPWLHWFLSCLQNAILFSRSLVQKSLDMEKFWNGLAGYAINERQRKVILRLWEAEPGGLVGGLSNEKYRKIAQTSRESAKRDLADLLSKGVLCKIGGEGRSVRYALVTNR